MSNQQMVADFHKVFGTEHTAELRMALIIEETDEVVAELQQDPPNIPNLAKELADLMYVVYGTAAAYDIPLDDVFREVHKSNMSKLENGQPVFREDGKVLKGSNYEPPNINKVLYG